jgi:DeoR family ulaG and ulaABCDEF operon transcriptional repressor
MHERERWQVIKAMLRERPVVRIADVLKATGASEASVRRDFTKLAETGVASRVRGGLEASSSGAGESGYVPRTFEASSVLNIEAKRAIARAAVDLNEDGESIIINGGTTTLEMGAYLRDRRLKVLTNSYPLAEALIRDSQCRVALPGGEVYREERLIVSPFEDDATQHYSAARMFMSAISVGELGVIEGHPLVARANSSCWSIRRNSSRAAVSSSARSRASRG